MYLLQKVHLYNNDNIFITSLNKQANKPTRDKNLLKGQLNSGLIHFSIWFLLQFFSLHSSQLVSYIGTEQLKVFIIIHLIISKERECFFPNN